MPFLQAKYLMHLKLSKYLKISMLEVIGPKVEKSDNIHTFDTEYSVSLLWDHRCYEST